MLLLYIPCSSMDEANNLGKMVITEKLAACANIFPITSLYTWQGSIKEDGEYVLLLKTLDSKYLEILAVIKREHSYDVPAILSLNVDCNDEYNEWMLEQLR